MKKSTHAKSGFLLFVFCIQLVSSCAPERSSKEQLLENIQRRFLNNEYISNGERIINPYDEQGKRAGTISKKIIAAIKPLKQSFNKNTSFQLASSKLERSVSLTYNEIPKAFGIESPEQLSIVSEIFIEHNNIFNATDITKVNDALKRVPLTEDDALRVLDNSVKEGNMTSLQKDLMQLHYEELSSATSKADAISIADTFEYEIYNSQLSSDEKKLLLLNSSLIRNIVLTNDDLGLNQGHFKKTAAVATVVIFVLAAVGSSYVGYHIGEIVGKEVCPTGNNGYPDAECVQSWAEVGVVLGIAGVVAFI